MKTEYQLPEPAYFALTPDHTWLSVSKDQFDKCKQSHQMIVHTSAQVMKAYAAGREAMRQDALRLFEPLFEQDYSEGVRELKELK